MVTSPIEVVRFWYTPYSTIGVMSYYSDFLCYTLEPVKTDPPTKPRCIPAGMYNLTLRWSNKFQRLVPHVEGVPDFIAIEIHVGNYPHDTDGCTLVGLTRGPMPDFIGRSQFAFDKLYDKLKADAIAAGSFSGCVDKPTTMVYGCGTITYTDAPKPETVAPDVDGEISV